MACFRAGKEGGLSFNHPEQLQGRKNLSYTYIVLLATKNDVKGWACFGIRYSGSVSEGPEILFGGTYSIFRHRYK